LNYFLHNLKFYIKKQAFCRFYFDDFAKMLKSNFTIDINNDINYIISTKLTIKTSINMIYLIKNLK